MNQDVEPMTTILNTCLAYETMPIYKLKKKKKLQAESFVQKPPDIHCEFVKDRTGAYGFQMCPWVTSTVFSAL
jgi:hypothetical protein